MNIRLMGDGNQVAAAVAVLETLPGLRIASVSRPYANRRDPEQMRIYLDVEITAVTVGGDQRAVEANTGEASDIAA
ncbi:hypothetical protein [Couchioplanes caeruleus]|uniref:Uncharacterized protein n=2 Tax=Couchioplanes caeruleus TaxID=56438 RepID=A0A1K0GSW0_9ACTN|nr:hypothetical protein [Couchioplanes caeruleus]OJF15526.1 hypothetical protein BG844_04070 [Couchioplanes caeruleus subsp. caeruleus]ROP30934.1 hypothetical protein EDD30_3819 [Couchioplanes caeruleus]